MTEKLFTGTLNNLKKKQQKKTKGGLPYYTDCFSYWQGTIQASYAVMRQLLYLIRCLLLLTFRSLAAIVSEKSTVLTFSYRKTQVTKFDLAVK